MEEGEVANRYTARQPRSWFRRSFVFRCQADSQRNISIAINYVMELYEQATIERMGRHFRAVLEEMTRNVDGRIGEVTILSDAERAQLKGWNRTEQEYPQGDCYPNGEYEVPQGEIETALAQVWCEVLKLERIGRHDDFFQCGGRSLSATQLMSKIRSRLDLDLPLRALFERSTVARFAELIATAKKIEIPPMRLAGPMADVSTRVAALSGEKRKLERLAGKAQTAANANPGPQAQRRSTLASPSMLPLGNMKSRPDEKFYNVLYEKKG